MHVIWFVYMLFGLLQAVIGSSVIETEMRGFLVCTLSIYRVNS